MKSLCKNWENLRESQTQLGFKLLSKISLLAQIALNMVEGFPAASHLSLQISEVLDDLGRYAQWLIGHEKANELL